MKPNEIITLGNIRIRKDPKHADTDHGEAYTIFIFRGDDDKEYEQWTVYVFDFDMVILLALELKHEGINGNFATYASLMLNLDGEIWV